MYRLTVLPAHTSEGVYPQQKHYISVNGRGKGIFIIIILLVIIIIIVITNPYQISLLHYVLQCGVEDGNAVGCVSLVLPAEGGRELQVSSRTRGTPCQVGTQLTIQSHKTGAPHISALFKSHTDSALLQIVVWGVNAPRWLRSLRTACSAGLSVTHNNNNRCSRKPLVSHIRFTGQFTGNTGRDWS